LQRLKTILLSNHFYIITFILLIFYVLVFTKLISYESKYSLDDDSFTGIITDYNIDGNKLTMDIKGLEVVKTTYYIKNVKEKEFLINNILLGSRVELKGTFSSPLSNTIFNTFNYNNYLYNRKIYQLFNVSSYKLDNKISLSYKIKNYILKRINSMDDITDYLKTFVLGDKRELDVETYSKFQSNGVSHLFAISGMHIGLFSSLLLFLLRKLKLNEKSSFFIVFLFLLFYSFLTNYPSSIMRALIFMLFLNLNKIYRLELSNLKCLLLTVILLILFSPLIVYDLGFQYSCITVLGLILFSSNIKGSYIKILFMTSLIAFIFSLPITIYNFYEFNLLSPIINLLFVPLVSFVVYPLLLLNFMFPFLTRLSLLAIKLLSLINDFSSSFEFGTVVIPKVSLLFIICLYLFLFLFFLTRRKVFIFLYIVMIISFKFFPYLDNSNYVYYLDVGQGDSQIIVTEKQKDVIMIDTGGVVSFDNEKWKQKNRKYNLSNNIISFMKSKGIDKVSTMILSHGDFDHMGEAINLINNFKVEKVIFNCGEFNDLEKDLIKVLDKKKITYYSCIKELNIGDNKLYFLNNGNYDNENDNSSVIYTELNNHKFLFMGDAGVEVEEDLVEKYNMQNIDVLKVGHHGSKTSSSKEFINEIIPKYGVICVGKNNRYGHPNKEILNVLDNSKIYRTDKDGSIMFKFKNNKLKIETCEP